MKISPIILRDSTGYDEKTVSLPRNQAKCEIFFRPVFLPLSTGTLYNVVSRTCPDELGRSRTFHYSLTVDTVESGAFSCENYGVKISEDDGDTAAVPGITTSALRIDELMTLLVEHGVGPASLRDVVDDWL